MLHTKFQGHWLSGSGEEDFKGFLPYMGVAVVLVIRPIYIFCIHFGQNIIRSQVWYLIVSIPDLCTLTYFHMKLKFNWANGL